MNSVNDTGAVAGPAAEQTSYIHRLRGLAVTGLVATLVAVATTTVAAALARAVGVDFEIPDGGETIPLAGFAVVTGFLSVVGVLIAAALLRWSAPLLSGGDTATIAALFGLHLVPAAVMIPTLTRGLRARTN
ncbi:DUF6069 family protein [Micromonospora sp. NPDC050695]|uniref:DUF6069 family protein n=1 Tax=Micromonospora sp. NPDC050695 TaxID=3154938 RepID=UPI0033DF74E9